MGRWLCCLLILLMRLIWHGRLLRLLGWMLSGGLGILIGEWLLGCWAVGLLGKGSVVLDFKGGDTDDGELL